MAASLPWCRCRHCKPINRREKRIVSKLRRRISKAITRRETLDG